MTVRVGFYGAGFISSVHTWFLHHSGVAHDIVAVHDPDRARAEAFAAARGATAVGEEEELLDLVDAVYVTAWTAEHPRLVAQAARRGRAVFCEKPLAVDAPTAAGMVEAVEAAGVVNQVGFVLRYMPSFLVLRDLLADERAGRVLAVVFRDDQYLPTQGMYGSTWRGDAARAGRGTLLEHSIHDVDILRWMLGPVVGVSGRVREVHGLPRIDDVAVARLDFADGAVATLTSVWHDILERPSLRRVEVFCERLHAVLEGDVAGPVRWRFAGEEERSLAGDELARAALPLVGSPAGGAAPELAGTVVNPASAFLAAVRDGHPAQPCFAEALPAHRIVDAIYASAEAGGAPVAVAEHESRPGEVLDPHR